MADLHKAVVLRTASAYKKRITLLDEQYGKIEGMAFTKQPLFHGALISYALKKKGTTYMLTDVQLLDSPLYWARENFLFFHHMLELTDCLLPWDEQAGGLFQLLELLYTHPEQLETPRAQKLFLYHFFRRLGMYPELRDETIESWIRSYLGDSHSFQTGTYFATVDSHEETV